MREAADRSLLLDTDSASQGPPPEERKLPSGRNVILRTGDGLEEIELRAPDGELEARIAMTDQGPVVTLRGGRLELEATRELSLKCQSLAIEATDNARIVAGGALHLTGAEARIKTEADIHLNGAFVRLNCPPDR